MLPSDTYAVPAPGKPFFQAATANIDPWTEAKVETKSPDRGPLLIISGEQGHTIPWALTIDSGWREVADTALAFVWRFV